MVGRLGKVTNSFDATVGQKIQDAKQQTWGEIPGKIVSFDPTKQTATIQPLYKPYHNGKPIDMPELYEVPVRFVRAGGGAMTHPVKAGDKVTLRPQMRNTENYHENEDGSAANGRAFSLADMEAHLAGGESLKDPIKNFDGQNTHMRFDENGQFGIRGSATGKFKIEGSEGNLYDIIATFMELVAADTLHINYGSSSGEGHRLQNQAALIALAAKVRAMAL